MGRYRRAASRKLGLGHLPAYEGKKEGSESQYTNQKGVLGWIGALQIHTNGDQPRYEGEQKREQYAFDETENAHGYGMDWVDGRSGDTGQAKEEACRVGAVANEETPSSAESVDDVAEVQGPFVEFKLAHGKTGVGGTAGDQKETGRSLTLEEQGRLTTVLAHGQYDHASEQRGSVVALAELIEG